ncbi:MAG TPA: hypothetical protein VGH87_23385 [Polyangiaceae bacterium]|jgi:hypothetical protein|nr:hypothetical protein [Polyangiaceae bacterium]
MNDVNEWFREYLDAFAACGRGERDASALLAYYGVPIFFTTDAGCAAMTSEEQVLAVAKQQVDGMRAAQYDHSEVLESESVVVNATSAIHRGTFVRVRADGSEINRVRVTYVITESARGRRISGLLVHH